MPPIEKERKKCQRKRETEGQRTLITVRPKDRCKYF